MDYETVIAVNPHLVLSPGPTTLADIDELYQAGVRWIIDCRAEFDDAPLLAQHSDIAYCYNPTQDDGQPKPPQWFENGYQFAKPHIEASEVGDPHCAAEVNRGPSMTYYILRRYDAWRLSPDAAEAAIRSVRPQVGIRYKADADAAISFYAGT